MTPLIIFILILILIIILIVQTCYFCLCVQQAVFKVYDHDKDGVICEAEFQDLLQNFPFVDAFGVLDTDKYSSLFLFLLFSLLENFLLSFALDFAISLLSRGLCSIITYLYSSLPNVFCSLVFLVPFPTLWPQFG